MKNLLVPAAIAIGGLFVVNHVKDSNLINDFQMAYGKHVPARHHRSFMHNEVAASVEEVKSNTIRVAHFAPIAEIVTSSFLIDFSDEQVKLADQEMNDQMLDSSVEIGLPNTEVADLEMMNQMEESLAQISIPDVKLADAEMIGNFTAK